MNGNIDPFGRNVTKTSNDQKVSQQKEQASPTYEFKIKNIFTSNFLGSGGKILITHSLEEAKAVCNSRKNKQDYKIIKTLIEKAPNYSKRVKATPTPPKKAVPGLNKANNIIYKKANWNPKNLDSSDKSKLYQTMMITAESKFEGNKYQFARWFGKTITRKVKSTGITKPYAWTKFYKVIASHEWWKYKEEVYDKVIDALKLK